MTQAGALSDAPLTRGRQTGRAPARPPSSAPGVTVEWVGPLLRQLDGVRSDVAGFVGFARRGDVQKPLRLGNQAEFDDVFGPPLDGFFLAHAVHGFFANGGDTCWVVRAADRVRAACATATTSGSAPLQFVARSPGTWANGLRVEVQPTGGGFATVTLSASDGRREVWQNLSVDSIRELRSDVGEHTISDSALVTVTVAEGVTGAIDQATVVLDGGDDGLQTTTLAHLTGWEADGSTDGSLGAALFDDIDEIGLVAIPDLVLRQPPPPPPVVVSPPCPDAAVATPVRTSGEESDGLPGFQLDEIVAAQASLVGACEALRDRIALLQHPDPLALPDAIVEWRDNFTSAFGAIYWPWLQIVDPARPSEVLAVPPCGHVAGIVARSDWAAGPHKPPANEVVVGAVGLTMAVDDAIHGAVNSQGVNAIRSLSGRGIRVLGARTTSNESDWRYLNVRRLMSQIERSVASYAEWLVFEPDDEMLREDLGRVIRRFLDDLWRAGALDGRTAAEAYSVNIEPTPAGGSEEGRLIVEIGVLPPWPAEFVIVRIDVTQVGARVVPEGRGHNAFDR